MNGFRYLFLGIWMSLLLPALPAVEKKSAEETAKGTMQEAAGKAADEVMLAGRIVCLGLRGQTAGCEGDVRRFALETKEDGQYFFMERDSKAEMFTDARIRAKDLVIRAWLRPAREIEIIKVFSVRDGKLHDIHYFCEICNIRAYAPEPCWCCQQDFELREDPVSDP